MADWFFGQTVNSLTALGFVVVGVLLILRTDRRWIGTASIATGIGSFLFHGPMPGWAQVVHDVTLWFLVVVAVAAIVDDLRHGAPWKPLLGPLALLGSVALIGRLGATGGPFCDPESILQPHGLWHLGAAVSLFWWATLYPTPARRTTA